MQIIITNADGTERSFDCPVQTAAPISNLTRGREWKSIAVIGTADEVKAAFVDGITYRQQWESAIIAEDGTQTTETQTRDLSDYCVAGDVVDTRDGNVTVYMGRKTEVEKLREQVDVLDVLLGEEA